MFNKIDLPDCLPASMVRDLRTNLRTAFFWITTLGLPVLLAMLVAGGVKQDEYGEPYIPWLTVNILFFCVTAFVLVIMIPFGAYLSVKVDTKSSSTNFAVLSPLTSWQIVRGKWLAVVVQILCTALLVLPVLLWREAESPKLTEFMGIFGQLGVGGFLEMNISWLIVASVVGMVAGAVAMFAGGVPFLMALIAVLSLVYPLFTWVVWKVDLFGEHSAYVWWHFVVMGLFAFVFLNFTRRFYSPLSENTVWPMRVALVVAFLVGVGMFWTYSVPDPVVSEAIPAMGRGSVNKMPASVADYLTTISPLMLIMAICIFADLLLPARFLRIHHKQADRANVFSCMIPKYFRMPGWYFGLPWVLLGSLFVATLFLMNGIGFKASFQADLQQHGHAYLAGLGIMSVGLVFALYGTVLFPLVLVGKLRRWSGNNLSFWYGLAGYIGMMVVMGLMSVVSGGSLGVHAYAQGGTIWDGMAYFWNVAQIQSLIERLPRIAWEEMVTMENLSSIIWVPVGAIFLSAVCLIVMRAYGSADRAEYRCAKAMKVGSSNERGDQ